MDNELKFFIFSTLLILVMSTMLVIQQKKIKAIALVIPTIISFIVFVTLVFKDSNNSQTIDMGISILGIAITVWVGLNIYNVIEKKQVDNLDEKINKLEKEYDEKIKVLYNTYSREVEMIVSNLEKTEISIIKKDYEYAYKLFKNKSTCESEFESFSELLYTFIECCKKKVKFSQEDYWYIVDLIGEFFSQNRLIIEKGISSNDGEILYYIDYYIKSTIEIIIRVVDKDILGREAFLTLDNICDLLEKKIGNNINDIDNNHKISIMNNISIMKQEIRKISCI